MLQNRSLLFYLFFFLFFSLSRALSLWVWRAVYAPVWWAWRGDSGDSMHNKMPTWNYRSKEFNRNKKKTKRKISQEKDSNVAAKATHAFFLYTHIKERKKHCITFTSLFLYTEFWSLFPSSPHSGPFHRYTITLMVERAAFVDIFGVSSVIKIHIANMSALHLINDIATTSKSSNIMEYVHKKRKKIGLFFSFFFGTWCMCVCIRKRDWLLVVNKS